mmetsp:Transcript_23726/g.94095  ORF Transcript_23726/g.94095 Transcript_23726/m.94095 type:complete len:308 (+) Transcript_23726:110-1033(+)
MPVNPSLRRIRQDIRELASHPSPMYAAAPLEDDLFTWHFTVKGPPGTDFAGGAYHGKLQLPPEYPFKPPAIMLFTPSGRFETNTKICLSNSDYHPEHWQPAWGIRTILEALVAFFPTPADSAIGALQWRPDERRALAIKSRDWVCAHCGAISALVQLDDTPPRKCERPTNASRAPGRAARPSNGADAPEPRPPCEAGAAPRGPSDVETVPGAASSGNGEAQPSTKPPAPESTTPTTTTAVAPERPPDEAAPTARSETAQSPSSAPKRPVSSRENPLWEDVAIVACVLGIVAVGLKRLLYPQSDEEAA